MEKEYTIPQLSKKSGVGYKKIYQLVRDGLKHKVVSKEVVFMKNVRKGKKLSETEKRKLTAKRKAILINYSDWLEIPAFLREKWKENTLKKSKKTTKIEEADILKKT